MKTITFLLTGFRNEQSTRVFTFEGVGPDRVRNPCTVTADLALIRKYSIRVQELPLLCKGLLERQETVQPHAKLILDEGEMSSHATRLADAKLASDAKRLPSRRGAGNRNGAAWRTSPF
jgi:hypothetical protein